MPLWCEDFALDTETDDWGDGQRTVLVQACPVSARSVDEVRLWYGRDAWKQFMKSFEETSEKKLKCHCYNLGNFESVSIIRDALECYEFSDSQIPEKGQWTMIADKQTVYKISVKNSNGCILEFSDDMRRVGGASMRKTAESVRKEHPEWWNGLEVKEETDYHKGWLKDTDPFFEESIHYSKVDAYSQAMIARYLISKGCDRKLTAPSMGLSESLALKYRKKDAIECDSKELHYATLDFRRWYPPLDREMQDIAEESILGGFVWGETGVWRGTFCHADYSSSYPYEYAYGDLFYGRVLRARKGSKAFDALMTCSTVFRWVLVSYDFSLKRGMMPCLSGKDCLQESPYGSGTANLKMREGRVEKKLYTWTYFEELQKHYDVRNVEIHEIWSAKRRTGDFEPIIRHFYERKNDLKHSGLNGSAAYNLTKLYMNGGIHGKTITKTRRERRLWDSENRCFRYEKEVNDPELCFMVGFTAMMNARERLLRHCRRVIESGHHVMMCDTDSMVVDCSSEELRSILGDWIVSGPSMEESLGRFELEDDSEGLRRYGVDAPVSEDFDEFRCWGLKRYCEVRTIEGHGRLCRKTAFAGMHDEVQESLIDIPVDIEYEFEWIQKGKRTGDMCAEILDVCKHASARSVWFEDDHRVKSFDRRQMRAFMKGLREARERLGYGTR